MAHDGAVGTPVEGERRGKTPDGGGRDLLTYALRLGRTEAKVKTMSSIGSLIYSGVIPLVKM